MKHARLLGIALLLATAASCHRKNASSVPGPPPDVPPRLGTITIENLTPPESTMSGIRIDVQTLTTNVHNTLRTAGIFAPGQSSDAGAGSPAARVRCEFAIEEVKAEGKAAARAMVRFRIDVRPAESAAPHWNDDVQAGSESVYALGSPPDRQAVFSKLVTRTVNDLVAAYIARQRIWRGSGAEIETALHADAGETRIEAIRAVSERRLTAETPTLLRLLTDEDESVRDAALGALVELREQKAVTEIAKQRSMRDRREMRKILDAMATLGGQEAMDYLSFVADAHEDEDIRAMAKKALERAKRRAAN